MLFYAEASRVLGEVDRLATTTAQIREGQSGRLVIASHPAAAISLLPPLVADFLRRASRRVGAPDLAPFRRGEPAPAEREASTSASPSCRSTRPTCGWCATRCAAWRSCRRAIRSPSRKVLTPALLSGQPMVAPARSPQMLSRVYGDLRRRRCADQRGGRGGVLRQPAARWSRPAPAGRWSIRCRPQSFSSSRPGDAASSNRR